MFVAACHVLHTLSAKLLGSISQCIIAIRRKEEPLIGCIVILKIHIRKFGFCCCCYCCLLLFWGVELLFVIITRMHPLEPHTEAEYLISIMDFGKRGESRGYSQTLPLLPSLLLGI